MLRKACIQVSWSVLPSKTGYFEKGYRCIIDNSTRTLTMRQGGGYHDAPGMFAREHVRAVRIDPP